MPLILIPVLLLLVPTLEIAVFVKVGQVIGVWRVVALVFLAALAGAALLRYQSIGVIRRLDRDLKQGRVPDAGLFDGFLIVVGAVLLILPGFLTDVIGLLLMIPLVRRLLRNFLKSRVTVRTFGGFERGFRRHRRQDDVVDLSPEDFQRDGTRDPPRPGIDHRD